MENKNVLNDIELRQVNGGRDEYTIPIPKPGEFWHSWNPTSIVNDTIGFIDTDDYEHPLVSE